METKEEKEKGKEILRIGLRTQKSSHGLNEGLFYFINTKNYTETDIVLEIVEFCVKIMEKMWR